MNKNKAATATLAALGAQVIFGFSFMFTKIALKSSSPLTVIANRYMVAFIGLSIVMLITGTKIKLKKNLWKVILMSVFQPVLYFIFESYGIKMTTSAFSSIIISLIPVVSMVCGIFVLKEIPSPMQYVFSLVSVGGVAVMTLVGSMDGTASILGIALLFGAVVSSVAYNITSRKISEEFTVFERTYFMTVIGLVVFTLIALTENIHNPVCVISSFIKPDYTGAIFYLGIVSSVVAFLLLNYANTYLPVAKTTVFSNITTIVSVFAGMIFLNEKFTVLTAVSTIMIIVGVWGVQALSVRKK